MLQIVIAGIARRIARMLAAIKLGNVVHRIPQGADACAGKEIEKNALHRVTNRNGIGQILDPCSAWQYANTKLNLRCGRSIVCVF